MQEKHSSSKETDITGVLVVVLVLMVGVVIAKVAGDFTTQKTSSSTRAAASQKGKLTTKPKVVGRVRYQSGGPCYNPDDPNGTYKWWFNSCIKVNQDECQDKCQAGQTISDETSYGAITCPGKKRCLPLSGAWNAKSQFSFTTDNLSSTFCESMTGRTGAVCYDPSGGVNIKGLDISKYDSFYTQDRNTTYGDYTYYIEGGNFFWSAIWGNYYWVECPLYVSILGGGVDTFMNLGGAKVAPLDHAKSGYCYVPKETTP